MTSSDVDNADETSPMVDGDPSSLPWPIQQLIVWYMFVSFPYTSDILGTTETAALNVVNASRCESESGANFDSHNPSLSLNTLDSITKQIPQWNLFGFN